MFNKLDLKFEVEVDSKKLDDRGVSYGKNKTKEKLLK